MLSTQPKLSRSGFSQLPACFYSSGNWSGVRASNQRRSLDMPETKKQDDATENRPVPSQAEGDEKTVDESLKQKESKDRK